jgi:hypothetical protein
LATAGFSFEEANLPFFPIWQQAVAKLEASIADLPGWGVIFFFHDRQ